MQPYFQLLSRILDEGAELQHRLTAIFTPTTSTRRGCYDAHPHIKAEVAV